MRPALNMSSFDGTSRISFRKKLNISHGALVTRRYLRMTTTVGLHPCAFGDSGGGGNAVGRNASHALGASRKDNVCAAVGFLIPQRHAARRGGDVAGAYPWSCHSSRSIASCAAARTAASSGSSSSERPFFPPMGVPSDSAISDAISNADSWQQLRDAYTANARRIDPAQLLALTQRLAHVTGVVVWPDGAALPEPTPPGGAPWAPTLTEREAEELVALAQNLCRATQVCLPEVYDMQQVAGLLQAFVSLGVAPPAAWLRSAELVALKTQREGMEGGGRTATSELLNELLAIAAAFQRLGHVPDRSFVSLMGAVRPLEEGEGGGGGQGESERGPLEPEVEFGSRLLLVLAAPQLLCLARAVLLWGLQPPPEWPELFLQATYTRISRANKLAEAGAAAAGLASCGDEAVEAAEAEAALGVGGLATLLWAAVVMEARPADPGGSWMVELSAAALRRLHEVAVVAAATATASGATAAAAAATAARGGALPFEASDSSPQDIASLLSALQQMKYDPGPEWINTCLQAAAVVQARTDPSAAVSVAAAAGSPPPGDALAAVLFLAAQYDHPQDDETRRSVVGTAQVAQTWMQLQGEVAAAATVGSSCSSSSLPPPLFSSRGLTQLMMALVRMGGQPSEEWVAAWAAAAEPLTKAAAGGGGFDVDQMVAVIATAAEAEVQLPEQLQRAMVQGLILPPPPAAAAAAPAAAAAAAAPGISGLGAFLPSGAGAAGAAHPAGSSTLLAVRSLPQFRQLLGILELQSYPLEPDWLEAFTALVEDFRLRLGSREVLSVLRVLGSFRDTVLLDTAGAVIAKPTPATSSTSPNPSTSSTSSSRRSSGPIVIRPTKPTTSTLLDSTALPPNFPFLGASTASTSAAASTASTSAAVAAVAATPQASSPLPTVLDSRWVASLLEDVRVRGGIRGPNDLMQLSQALSSLSAPPSLLSYIEIFALALTGEDGRRRAPTSRRITTPTATANVAAGLAAAATASSGSPAAAAAAAAAAKPSVARIRLRLQKEAAERRSDAAAAGAEEKVLHQPRQQPQQQRQTMNATAEDEQQQQQQQQEGEEEEEEPEQWSLAWPAMLGAFAAAGHIPERRWWDRFAAATLPSLETYEAPMLASLAMAALGLSSQAAEEEGEGEEGSLEAKLLPSLAWHQQALSYVAEAIRACPVSMDEVWEQAVQVLSEQRRRRRRRTATATAADDDAAGNDDDDNDDEEADRNEGDSASAPLEFSAEEFSEVVLTLSSQLPMLIETLARPRVPLPPQLLELLKEVAEEAADGAAAAVAAAAVAAGGQGFGGLAGGKADKAVAIGRREGSGGDGDGGGGGVDLDLDLDAIAYAQQVVTLVMQTLLTSDYSPGKVWMAAMADVMLVSRAEWGPASETGELQQQQQLLLNADQLTTFSYIAGKFEMPMAPEQVRLMLQHAARLVSSGELAAGELAATLAGLSGVPDVEVVEEGPEEVAELLEALASQSGRLSPSGLSEAATALLQLGLGLHSDMAARFRTATARSLQELAPPQMLTVLTVGGSLGLEPPSRELLATLSMQVGRLAAHPDQLAPAAATEAAYQVLKWFPEVAPNDSELYIDRIKAGLQPLLGRLEEVVPASAAKLALLLATTGLVPGEGEEQEQEEEDDNRNNRNGSGDGGSGSGRIGDGLDAAAERRWQRRSAALAPLVEATADGLQEYDDEQLSNAIMGLSLLGLRLPSTWLESFMEASRRQLSDADGRSLSYLLSGLADQGVTPGGPFMSDFWAAVRQRAGAPEKDLDLLSARTLLEAAGQLGLRPDRDLMQSILDCALLRHREAPDTEGLAELVQVMASFSFVPSSSWAAEVRSVLTAPLTAMDPALRSEVLSFLHGVMPRQHR